VSGVIEPRLDLARGLWVGAVYLSTRALIGRDSASAGVTALLNSTNVVFAPLFACVLLSEKIVARAWLAILLTLVGLAILESHSISGLAVGDFLALGSGLLAGAVITVVRSLRSEPNPERPETIVFFYSLIGIPIAALLCTSEPWNWPLLPVGCSSSCSGSQPSEPNG